MFRKIVSAVLGDELHESQEACQFMLEVRVTHVTDSLEDACTRTVSDLSLYETIGETAIITRYEAG